jgi:hypothetical protein
MKELYEKFVKKPISMVDSGELFKNGLNLILKLAALALVLFGLYVCISGLFGDSGYFNLIKGADGFLTIRCIVTFLITFCISLLTYVAIALVLWYQADDIKENYDGIILLPSRFFKIFGQIVAVALISLGLINFVAALFAGVPFARVGIIQQFIPKELGGLMGLMGLSQQGGLAMPPDLLAYLQNLLFVGILGLVASVIIAFLVIIIFYIIARGYEILVKFFQNGGNYFKSGK